MPLVIMCGLTKMEMEFKMSTKLLELLVCGGAILEEKKEKREMLQILIFYLCVVC